MKKDGSQQAASLPDESINGWDLQFIESFGVWHLSINDAAELIALDMWFSGEFPDIEEPEEWDGSERDPTLLALLEDKAALFASRLLAAVEKGRLKDAGMKRDFDERIDPKLTYVSYSDLNNWLFERGYDSGDIFDEWMRREADITNKIIDQVAYLRASQKAGKLSEALRDKSDGIIQPVVAENRRLKEQIAALQSYQSAKVDRPLSTRQRRTLLTVIAAFCNYGKIAPSGRGTAQRIREMTEEIGAPIDDGTIAKLLAEIPDALETRMK